MPQHIYRIRMRDGSLHQLAADNEAEARRLAREYYTGNIAGVKRDETKRKYRVTFYDGTSSVVEAANAEDAKKKARAPRVNKGGPSYQPHATVTGVNPA